MKHSFTGFFLGLMLGLGLCGLSSAQAATRLHIPVLRNFTDGESFDLSAYQNFNSYAGAPITGLDVMAKNLQGTADSSLTFAIFKLPIGPQIDVLNYRIYSLFPNANAVIPASPVAPTALQMQVHGQVQVDWVDVVIGP